MKIQTTASITSLSVDDAFVEPDSLRDIELEFSAIDTGGAFRDPILDFSFRIPKQNKLQQEADDGCHFNIGLGDPNTGKEIAFGYEGPLREGEHGDWEINGRLKDEQLSRELIGFVLQLLR
ncbi:MAG: hypothetical protein U5J63_03315 [Fodinibius sp.]|nr:hypothetical protein [Fodinibius sp.]